ncbi:hypothetical protein F5X96DRAFT_368737 [Biscogniauxia mediterranea]|nr:hypothetical protein F5X96DRAFT_368737 [Biscogniauxia mediterranea]
MPSRASFLGLPYEIRDAILELVLYQPRRVPTVPSLAELSRRKITPLRRQLNYSRHIYASVLFDADPLTNPAVPLLLINHQIHDETVQILSRMASRPQDIALDFLCLDNGSIWPTWLSLPTLGPRYRTLYIRVRLCATPDGLTDTEMKRSNPDFVGFDDWPSTCAVDVSLRTFAQGGPLARQDSAGITAEHLVMDFLPTAESNVLPFGLAPELTPWAYLQECIPNYDTFALDAPSDLSLAAGHTMSNYILTQTIYGLVSHLQPRLHAAMLYERFGDFEVRLNGTTRARIDMADMLARFPFVDSDGEPRLASFDPFTWKDVTTEKRRKAGLPVKDSSETITRSNLELTGILKGECMNENPMTRTTNLTITSNASLDGIPSSPGGVPEFIGWLQP